MEGLINVITIIEIEKIEKINYDIYKEEDYPLVKWYKKVRHKNILELTDGDVARFIRQRLYEKYIVPEAIKRLWDDPTSGELYYGEIIINLSRLDLNFWINNYDLIAEMIKLLNEMELGNLIPKEFEWMCEREEKHFFKNIEMFKDKLEKLR